MPKRTPQDWETLKQELHAAGGSPAEVEAPEHADCSPKPEDISLSRRVSNSTSYRRKSPRRRP
jgi:hypothetical protein